MQRRKFLKSTKGVTVFDAPADYPPAFISKLSTLIAGVAEV